MTARGQSIAQRLAADLEDLRDHERLNPDEVETIVAHLVGHLRSWRPESVAPLGTMVPTELERDPRTAT